MADTPELKTRKPTGKPPWPMILLAGAEKTGKSYSAAAFSASDLIDRTFYLELGEGYADHYGSIPGARYEILEHDGTYIGIGRALRAATLAPRPNGKPHAIILDPATELWDLLAEEAQATANRRKGKDADGEAQITMDLWNVAKKRWRHIIDLLRQYDGPVVITARLEQVTVMDQAGKPTTAKEWKVRAEKNLPFECDAVVKMPVQGTAILTGVRSLLLRTGPGLEVSDFSVEKLLTSMGIRPGETQERSYTAPRAEQPQDESQQERQAERSTGIPETDPWATQPDAPTTPAEQSQVADAVARKAQAEQRMTPAEALPDELLTTVNIALREHGHTTDEARYAEVSRLTGRPIGSTKELSRGEAMHILRTLATQTQPEATQPEGWTDEQRDQLVADLLAALLGAGSEKELVAIGQQIADAVNARKISPADRETLSAGYKDAQAKGRKGARKQPAGANA